MAEHMLKKYIAKVEKTVYVVETIEFVCETERAAEELLDCYCANAGEAEELDVGYELLDVIDIEEQEFTIDHAWIESSEELTEDEFMEIDNG